jgi:hypothetical protein
MRRIQEKTRPSIRSGMPGVVMVALTLSLSGAVAAAPDCGANPGHPKCGGDSGGDSSGEVTLVTTFDCPAGDGCPLSTWQDDGNGPYLDGQDNVKSRFNSAGGYVLTMHERQNRIGNRKVLWNSVFGGVYGSVPDGTPFSDTGDLDALGYAHKTVIQAGKHTDIDLRTLAIGDPVEVDMLFDLLYFGERKQDNGMVSVRYAGDLAPEQCPGLATDAVTVTRTADTTWEIAIPELAQGCVFNSSTQSFPIVKAFGALTLTLVQD